jgi:uncharacterized membrane protein (DUF373 family)
MAATGLGVHYQDFRRNWSSLGVYERFEQIVAVVLTVLIATIVVAAVWNLVLEVWVLVRTGFTQVAQPRVFQAVFGQVATVLIALEFNHSIVKVVIARRTMIRVRTVLLIAVLALARKFIIFETADHTAGTLLALGAVMVALGLTYFLVGDRGVGFPGRRFRSRPMRPVLPRPGA